MKNIGTQNSSGNGEVVGADITMTNNRGWSKAAQRLRRFPVRESKVSCNGVGYMLLSGYVTVCVVGKRGKIVTRGEHRVIWELANGPIPRGYHVHHINKVRSDNRLENLAMIEAGEHIRQHRLGTHPSFIELPGGGHGKACCACHVIKPIEDFYNRPLRPSGLKSVEHTCKRCANARVCARAKQRRAEARLAA